MKKTYLAALAVAAVLAACGGGGDGGSTTAPDPTAQVPASASASADGFIAYLKALVASAADMLEPVDTSAVAAQTDDVNEPQAVD
jgi:hypothetical protein